MKTETKITLGASPPLLNKQELKLPHERDQSVQIGEDNKTAIGAKAKKAEKDARKGIPDTSRALEANVAYQRQK